MTFSDPFSEIAAVLAVAAAIGALAFWLRQPLIIAFIFAGILLGPAGLGWVHALDQVDLFAKLGIGLLLFVLAVLFGANMSFATPFGYQTNLLILSAGGYKFSDFFRVGIPLAIIMWIDFSIVLPLLYDI